MQEFWDSYKNRVNEKIGSYFNIQNKLIDSMTYSLLAGGKRFRPVVSGASAYALGEDPQKVLDYGLAIEFIHTYSLIHDDLPGMDDSDLRRGKLSNHRKFGEGIAILAGDSLLTEAFFILSQLKFPASNKIRLLELVAKCSGYMGMCGGQLLDLEMSKVESTCEDLLLISNLKTAALIEACVLGPAYLFEASEEKIEALNIYSKNIGVVFQMVDDLLDVTGDKNNLGKDTGKDAKNCKKTFPELLGVDGTRKLIEERYEKAIRALDIFDEKKKYLHEIARFIVERDR